MLENQQMCNAKWQFRSDWMLLDKVVKITTEDKEMRYTKWTEEISKTMKKSALIGIKYLTPVTLHLK